MFTQEVHMIFVREQRTSKPASWLLSQEGNLEESEFLQRYLCIMLAKGKHTRRNQLFQKQIFILSYLCADLRNSQQC